MAGSYQVAIPKGAVLWKKRRIVCTCLIAAPDDIEIALVAGGVVVQSGRFNNADKASRFAIDLMHAYRGD